MKSAQNLHESIENAKDRPAPSITLEALFGAKKDKSVKRILLLGEAGVSKSALCKKIVHSWAEKKLYSKNFEAIFYLPVEKLNTLTNGEKNSPVEFLAKATFRHSLQEKGSVKDLQSLLHTDAKRLLFIIDGYDQASEELLKILPPILKIDRFHFIVTSRHTFLDPEDFSHFDRRISCLGFTTEQMFEYCTWLLESVKDIEKDSIEEFLTALEENLQLVGPAKNPLYVQLFCNVWKKKSKFPSSQTDLYRQVVDQMCDFYYHQKEKKKYPDYRKEKKCLSLALGKAATLFFEKGELLSSDLFEIAERQESSFEDFTKSGFLKTSGVERDDSYQFPHPTFPEFFIAYKISESSFEEQKKFIEIHRNRADFQGVLAFLAGLIYQKDLDLKQKNTKHFFTSLCEKIQRERESCWLEELVFRCLNECPGYREKIPALEQLGTITDLLEIPVLSVKSFAKLPLVGMLCAEGLEEALEWLVSTIGKSFLREMYGKHFYPLTFFAAMGGQLKILQWLKQQDHTLFTGPKITGSDLIHVAAASGHMHILKWLHLQNIDKNLWEEKNVYGRTFIHLAALEGHIEVLRWAKDHYPELLKERYFQEHTLVHLAAFRGHLKVLDWAKEECMYLFEEIDAVKCPFAYLVAREGHLEVLDWMQKNSLGLLKKRNFIHQTFLHLAAQKGNLELLDWAKKNTPELLGERDLLKRSFIFYTHSSEVLRWACENCLHLLEEKDFEGCTPIHEWAEMGSLNLLKWIGKNHPHLLREKNDKGYTPLHLAAKKMN